MQIILPIPSFIDFLQVLMFLLAFFVLMFHCFIKPYKKEASNVIETLILLNLLLVAAAYLEAPQDKLVVSLFIVILTVLPYLYAVGFLIWLAVNKMLVNYVRCFLCPLCCVYVQALLNTQDINFAINLQLYV